jgi:GNAT superfamily N-acetyltransferase
MLGGGTGRAGGSLGVTSENTPPGTARPPDAAGLERATLTAVPAERVGFDGPFVLRAFLGGTGRANAASALDPTPDLDLAARIPRIEAFYARLGLPARIRSTPLDPPGLAALLAARGYAMRDETVVLAGTLGFAAETEAEFLPGPTEEWLGVLATAEYQTPARRAEKARMPELLLPPAAWVLLRERGAPAAACFVVADGALAGFFDLAVRPEFQRRGLGRRVMAAGAAWARARGAAWAWGQVAAANAASLALNAGLGLREAYRYRYFLRG